MAIPTAARRTLLSVLALFFLEAGTKTRREGGQDECAPCQCVFIQVDALDIRGERRDMTSYSTGSRCLLTIYRIPVKTSPRSEQ